MNAKILICVALLATVAVAVGQNEGPDGSVRIATIRDPDYVPPEMRRIKDEKKTFSTINEGDKLDKWPSEEIKSIAGKSAWGDWRPKNGIEAEVIKTWGSLKKGSLKHLLKIVEGDETKYCVMGEEALDGEPNETGDDVVTDESGASTESVNRIDDNTKKVHDFSMAIHDYKEKMHYLLFIDSKEEEETLEYRDAIQAVLDKHPDGKSPQKYVFQGASRVKCVRRTVVYCSGLP
jgi:hypothetical protein